VPSLFIVATPIGNLEDISLRALRVLREVKLIAAEDTRKTRRLLNRYDIKTPMTSYHEHSDREKLDYLLGYLENDDVALVCNAGTPGISDPGYGLVVAASEHSIPVVPIPGPSVAITALVASGLPTDRFTFVGYLPYKTSARQRFLESIATEPGTIVALEAPHRLLAALNDIISVLGDKKIAVCRELTKLHEEVFRGSISEAIKYFAEPRGEFTLVIEGRKEKTRPEVTAGVKRQLHYMQMAGTPARQAIAIIAEETGISRKELYQTWLQLDKSREKDSCQSSGRSK